MKTKIGAAALALAAFNLSAFADQLLPVGDSFYASGNNSNFGVSPTINVGGVGPYRGIIQFDLASLPAGTTAASVTHANLILFVNKIGTAGAIDVNAALGPWAEATVNGANAPALGMTVATAVTVDTASVYIVIDATAVVKAWLGNNPSNHGLIVSASSTAPATSVFLDSKESASTSHPAVLDISLASGGGVGPTGPQGPAGPAGAQGPAGPVGATGPAGSLALPFAGSTTFNGSAFQAQNFQLGVGTTFSAAALEGVGGSSVGNSLFGGDGKLGVSATSTLAGKGGLFTGGASGFSAGGSGVSATGGNTVAVGFAGGAGMDAVGGKGPDGGSGLKGTGGQATGVSGTGGDGITGLGGQGNTGGRGGSFFGSSNNLQAGAGLAGFGGANLSLNSTGASGATGTGGLGNTGGYGMEANGGIAPGSSGVGGDGMNATGGTGTAAGGAGGNFHGANHSSAPGYGIYAVGGCSVSLGTCNNAAIFVGGVAVAGNLSKSGGSFKIDHPLDPANKFLYHSFVESPDMMNIYNGIVTLETDGSAWVQMPDWFQALNQDFRYQLTSMGAPGPNLYIASTVAGNRFRIAGGSAGASVSWQVTGIRHDAYAEAHRIPVEENKTAADQDHYIHPELFQQPAEKRIGAERIERKK